MTSYWCKMMWWVTLLLVQSMCYYIEAAPSSYPLSFFPDNYYPGNYPPPSKMPNPTNHSPQSTQHSIHVAEWNWEKVGLYFTFTAFIVVTGLSKVAFHHAHWLSSRVPESCLLIIVGVVVGAILYLCGVNEPDDSGPPHKVISFPIFTPDLFFFVLLPPVILESAYSLYDRSFLDNLGTILMHAVVGTLLNTFMLGPILYILAVNGAMGNIHYLPLTDTIVFSALISAVDPVAVLAIFQEVGVNKDLYYLLFGESLLNDAVTVVLYTTTVTFTKMSDIHGTQYGLALIAFFTVSLGGLLIGILFGLLTALLTKTTQDVRVVEPLAVLGIAYLSYLAAELFHFSGIISIIGCGLTQAHYALKNISDNSRITVTYFTKMISSTSDAIIFLFLGMVLVSKHHGESFHVGFVLWTLALCLICRFIGVFSLTGFMNRYRVKKVNLQEQLIMAYGGLRGAVAFSLVKMLVASEVRSKQLFLTTTLVVILFTVFVQGGSIKMFVNLLNIEKSGSHEQTLLLEINDNIVDLMMAGIEEITGVRGDNYLRRKIEYYDKHYLTKVFLNTTKSNSLTRLYEKLSLTQHFAHLYGPVTLVEDRKTVLLHGDTKRKLPRSASARGPSQSKVQDLFPGVQLRRRTLSDTTRPQIVRLDSSLRTSAEQLKKAFRSNPYQKFHERYDPNLVYDELDINNMLQRRALMARRITHEAALANRVSVSPSLEERSPFGEFFDKPLRKIHSELEGLYPEDVEGIDALLERARRRVARTSSTAGVYPSSQSPYGPSSLRSVESDSASSFAPSVRRTVSLAARTPRVRKVSAGLDPYPEAPEAQHLMDKRPRVSQDNTSETLDEETVDDESKL